MRISSFLEIESMLKILETLRPRGAASAHLAIPRARATNNMEYRPPPSLYNEAAPPAPPKLRAGAQGAWTFDSIQFGGVTPPRVRPRELPSYLSNNDQVQDARSGGTGDFVPKVIGVEDQWDALLKIVKMVDASMESTADGRAAGHTHAARLEAATKLIHNHTKVLNDIANPSSYQNIEGKALTQVDLVRVETFRSHYVDQCLREVACRLLGRQPGVHQLKVRLSPSNQAQLKVWTQTTTYLDGRIQSVDEEMPGRKPDMSSEAAAAMRDVLSEVGELGVTMAVAAGAPAWASFRRILETDGGFDSEADGAAAKHSHEAREVAARKLIHNHDRVLRDVINPSLLKSIEGKSLTQPDLNRVTPLHAAHVDQMLREVVRRLLGRRPGIHLLGAHLDLSNASQMSAWAKGASYLDARIQSTPDQKPGREPDMSPQSALALKAVLLEIIEAATKAAQGGSVAMGHGRWDVMAKSLRNGEGFSTLADGAASAHSHRAREDAASKLIGNHNNILKDVVNDSTVNIEGKPLTQLELERVAPELWTYVDECLREVARRLLGRRPGLDQIAEIVDPSNGDQAGAWFRTCRYLDGRIQGDPNQKPGREPDMSKMAAAAMRAVLKEVGKSHAMQVMGTSTPIWEALRRILECGEGFASEAQGAAAVHSHAAREEAARALIKNHENVLKDVTNPSRCDNIDGKPLTQLELQRVLPSGVMYTDQALREVVRRLLGCRPGLHQLEEHIDPYHPDQVAAWAQTANYLDGRIQSMDSEMLGRTPDMSASAAAAMRAVLFEVGGLGITAALDRSASYWAKLHEHLRSGYNSAAANFEAASKLIINHELVLRDVCNPSTTRDATTTAALTQTTLVRVPTAAAPYADQALREIARRLLADQLGNDQNDALKQTLISTPGVLQQMQVHAFATTCRYLDRRVQSSATEMPGRTPDMSPAAAAAMREVLRKVEAMDGIEAPALSASTGASLALHDKHVHSATRRSITDRFKAAISPLILRRPSVTNVE